jgi:hypothetical protein
VKSEEDSPVSDHVDLSRLAGSVATNTRWAGTGPDGRRTATEKAREVGAQRLAERLEREVDPDGDLDPVERAARITSARKAHYARMALKSHQARRDAAEAARHTADRLALEAAQAVCGHSWPDELEAEATCLDCGLPYDEWTEPAGGAA